MITDSRKLDAGKPRWSLVPWSSLAVVLDVLEYGAAKYGPHLWLRVEPQRYREALMRHAVAYMMGDVNDDESGLPHLAHVACNALFLIALESDGPNREETR